MAGIVRHGNRAIFSNGKSQLLQIFHGRFEEGLRFKSNGRKSTRPPPRIKDKFEWSQESLRQRGFLRPLKSYQPSADVSERLDNICKNQGLSSDDSTVIDDISMKFNILNACTNEFNCSVPNSLLYTIETIGQLREFYKTPIDTTLPLDAARNSVLPENLHIIYEYNRFSPETDDKFNGKTAFPRSSTLVTGLKYKKKYPGLNQKSPFADN